MVCGNQHRIKATNHLRIPHDRAAPAQGAVFARRRDFGDERVVIRRFGPARLDQFHQLQRRAFANVGHVLLVGQTQDQHPGPAERLARLLVQRQRQPIGHMVGHGGVDLAGQFDEAGGLVELARFPGQVERVDRDAVPAQPRPRIERHEAKGLGAGGVDHLPHVDAHGVVDQLQLVHEGDVDGAKDVLGQLDRLGRRRAGYRNHGFHDCPIERRHQR